MISIKKLFYNFIINVQYKVINVYTKMFINIARIRGIKLDIFICEIIKHRPDLLKDYITYHAIETNFSNNSSFPFQ